MPYSDVIPPLLLPDCEAARDEVKRDETYLEYDVVFCRDFKPSRGRPPGPLAIWKDTCANRRLDGDRDHNWCTHCLAGYPVLTPKEQTDFFGDGLDEQSRRGKALHLGF